MADMVSQDDEPQPRQPASAPPDSRPRIIIIGAGSRGRGYGANIKAFGDGIVTAVAEPDDYKRADFGRRFIGGDLEKAPTEDAQFRDWRDFVTYETARRKRQLAGEPDVPIGVNAAMVCVLDHMHRDVVLGLVKLGGLHIMCEKPLATTLEHCVEMYRALEANRNDRGESMIFSVGHVLRYSPHNMLLRKLLLEDRVIGDILSVDHTEPVGWWHFSHSFVRGKWRRESTSAPSLLTKCCHDIDLLLWILCSPPFYGTNSVAHLPAKVGSMGALQYFKKSRKPAEAGRATNCLSCPAEASCKYSAKRIYVGPDMVGLGTGNKGWPVDVVAPDIESYQEPGEAQARLLAELGKDYGDDTPDEQVAARNWFGRCVYESDNDVCDEQVVTLTWDEDAQPLGTPGTPGTPPSSLVDPAQGRGSKTATIHMVSHTSQMCIRSSNWSGVNGEVFSDSRTITVRDFRTGETSTHHPEHDKKGHGDADRGLTQQFLRAVDLVKNYGWPTDRAQKEIVACTLEEVVRSHSMVFCADEARREEKVIDWVTWWDERVSLSRR